MTTQPSPTGPLGDELRSLLRLIEDTPSREPEPPREANVIPARTLERQRQRDDANRGPREDTHRRSALERPVPPAPPVPPAAPAGGGMSTRALSLAAVGIAGAVVVAGWFVLGQRTSPTAALARDERPAARELGATVAQVGPPVRSATAPATHTPDAPPIINDSTSALTARPNLTLQPITAAPNERVRVLVRIEPWSFSDNALLRVRGLPQGATLSRGRFVQPDSWIVPAGDVTTLELVLGDVAAGRFNLAAELQTDKGRTLAQASSQLVVNAPAPDRTAAATPVSRDVTRPPSPALSRDSGRAAPSTLTIGDAPDQSHDKFLAQGLRLLLAGSVNSARLLLQRAADAGNAHAALILGDTYDELRLAQLGAHGVMPDRDKANYWYGRADELGAPEAKDRLSEVNSR